MPEIAIIVHGGAGKIEDKDAHRRGLRRAAEEAYKILSMGGDSLDCVCEAVRIMEDDPVFNCGTGAVLNIEGEVEMDASVMTSEGKFGACGGIRRVKNPILVAKKIMEEANHLLLAGEGAIKFAREFGFADYDPRTEEQIKRHQELLKSKESRFFPYIKKFIRHSPTPNNGSTVGACALDKKGRIAVANSTGGIRGKLPGRLGDSAIIGAGSYATSIAGAVATGHGEMIMKLLLTKRVCELAENTDIQSALNAVIAEAKRNDCLCGLIGVDRRGNVGYGKTSEDMSWAYIRDGELISF